MSYQLKPGHVFLEYPHIGRDLGIACYRAALFDNVVKCAFPRGVFERAECHKNSSD